jgi:alpha-glucosidase
MRQPALRYVLGMLFLLMPLQHTHAQEPVALTSPNGDVRVTVALKEKLDPDPAGRRLYYAAQFGGKDVLLDSPFGLGFKGAPPFALNLAIRDVQRRTVEETWQRVWGKRKNVVNHFNEMTLALEETQPPHRRVDLVFRAFDDGVAFRYVLPEAWGAFELAAEHTGFRFPGNPTVWAANFIDPTWSGFYGAFASPQESEFREVKMNEFDPTQIYGCPMLVQIGPEHWAALTEADLTDWAGMYFAPAAGQRSTLSTALSPRPDEMDVVVRSAAPRASPWRVLMLGTRPGDLIESDLVQNLNDPAAHDFSWIAPGKSAWDRWWSNSYAPEVDFEVGINTASMKYFVDLAAEMGWQYQLVDFYWYGSPFVEGTWEPHPTNDITTADPNLDIHEVIRYAGEKGVKIILWLHWAHADRQMDEAFPLYEQWGVAGVKIDFMNRDDQEMVNFYHRTVKKAADHHLLVDFHGAYKPTGWSRTYPNVITREGILGNEYSKWSDRITPEHTVTIPFTRGLLGEMDFTPGGFRNRTRETFRTENPAPNVMGTRVHQLAMLVVFESALQVLCDSPYNYRSSPAGTDFLKRVPTTWDDTRVLHGQPGDVITVARRAGDDWYLGSMTDWTPRTLELPLGFLDAGPYRAEIWADAYEAADYPDRLMKRAQVVTAQDTLTAVLAPGGGHVVHLTPAR